MNESQNRPRHWILQFFSNHPLLGFIGFVGSIASIICLAYAIWPTLPKRELSYSVQPIRTAYVEVNRPSDIRVTYKGKPMAGDLTAAQVMIWNRGREPIRHEDILRPIILAVSNAPIIERSFSREPLAGSDFQLDTNLSAGQLSMDWKILERGDTPIIQIVYAGKRDLPILLDGRIVGQQGPKQLPWPAGPFGWFLPVVVVWSAVGLLLNLYFIVAMFRTHRRFMQLKASMRDAGEDFAQLRKPSNDAEKRLIDSKGQPN